jgi:hypothetical protein
MKRIILPTITCLALVATGVLTRRLLRAIDEVEAARIAVSDERYTRLLQRHEMCAEVASNIWEEGTWLPPDPGSLREPERDELRSFYEGLGPHLRLMQTLSRHLRWCVPAQIDDAAWDHFQRASSAAGLDDAKALSEVKQALSLLDDFYAVDRWADEHKPRHPPLLEGKDPIDPISMDNERNRIEPRPITAP